MPTELERERELKAAEDRAKEVANLDRITEENRLKQRSEARKAEVEAKRAELAELERRNADEDAEDKRLAELAAEHQRIAEEKEAGDKRIAAAAAKAAAHPAHPAPMPPAKR